MPNTNCGFAKNGNVTGDVLLSFYGPTLFVDIGFDPAYVPGPGKVPAPIIRNVGALVDTGASLNCIDAGLAMQLNLPVVDRQVTSGAHGKKEVNVHVAQIHVPTLGHTIYGRFAAVDLIAGGQPHSALLGRTFLREFTMVYEGRSGSVTIGS